MHLDIIAVREECRGYPGLHVSACVPALAKVPVEPEFNDTLNGGPGNDVITGGPGRIILRSARRRTASIRYSTSRAFRAT
jgi:hypothetical protein